jgi:malonyl-CoA decarboxylase
MLLAKRPLWIRWFRRASPPAARTPARQHVPRSLFGYIRAPGASAEALSAATNESLCDRLLAPPSPNVRLACAIEVLDRFAGADEGGRRDFLHLLAERYSADPARLELAISRYTAEPDATQLAELHAASEPRRLQILRHLHEAPNGTALLLAMRGVLLASGRDKPGVAALDGDFIHLFSMWFNGGILELRRLDWATSGAVLTKLMRYEAVHPVESWEALRARMEPADRRCYGFFHPRMADEPLIFVEVALTRDIPTRISDILSLERVPEDPSLADTAVFYSISNCQKALRGIPFGSALIQQAMDALHRELPALRRAITLSPIPGFARWLSKQEGSSLADGSLSKLLAQPDWHLDAMLAETVRAPLMRAAARYLTTTRGREADPVARFHLGNGARIEQLDWLGDTSARGLRQSHGLMVNYRYEPTRIERNLRAFRQNGIGVASGQVRRLARGPLPARLSWRPSL